MKFGLLGEHLGHSYSPRIHGLLHGEAYGLCEVPPENAEARVQKPLTSAGSGDQRHAWPGPVSFT